MAWHFCGSLISWLDHFTNLQIWISEFTTGNEFSWVLGNFLSGIWCMKLYTATRDATLSCLLDVFAVLMLGVLNYNSRGRVNQPPPCTTVGVWVSLYVQGSIRFWVPLLEKAQIFVSVWSFEVEIRTGRFWDITPSHFWNNLMSSLYHCIMWTWSLDLRVVGSRAVVWYCVVSLHTKLCSTSSCSIQDPVVQNRVKLIWD